MAGVKGRSGGHNAKTVKALGLSGTFRKHRHAEIKNPDPPLGIPQPPKKLDGDAKKEWTRMLERLNLSRTLSTVDDGALYQYCRLFAETESIAETRDGILATIALLEQRLGEIELSNEGYVVTLQELSKLRHLEAGALTRVRMGRMALRAYLVEFGLTPASRGRVKVASGDHKQDDDGFADLDDETIN